jgi:hypothetical protein
MNHNHSTLGGHTMKVLTATLAVGLWLCLAATALPAANAAPSRGPQGLPGPRDSSPPVAQSPDGVPAANVPQSRGPQGLPGPRDSSPPVAQSPDVALPPPDEGLSAFTIMLISLGGALALTGVAYSITRAARHRRTVS